MPYFGIRTLFASLLLVSVAGCAKQVAEDLGVIPLVCGTDGARLQAAVNGEAWCADGNITAMADSNDLMLMGVSLSGSTLAFQLHHMVPGVHPLDGNTNTVLLSGLGAYHLSQDGDPGTLMVTIHDTVDHRLKAEFDVHLYSAQGAGSKHLTGSFDVQYTE